MSRAPRMICFVSVSWTIDRVRGDKKERVIRSNHTASIYIVTLPTSLNRDHRRRRLSPGRGGAPLLAIISRFGTTDPRHRLKATFSSPLCKSRGESRALQRRQRTGRSAKFAKEIRGQAEGAREGERERERESRKLRKGTTATS